VVTAVIEVSAPTLAAHPFLRRMRRDYLDALAAAASEATYPARHRIFEDGGHASQFWLIWSGAVAVDRYVPGTAWWSPTPSAWVSSDLKSPSGSSHVLARWLQATRTGLIARSGHAASLR
jgi:hypothetical protein